MVVGIKLKFCACGTRHTDEVGRWLGVDEDFGSRNIQIQVSMDHTYKGVWWAFWAQSWPGKGTHPELGLVGAEVGSACWVWIPSQNWSPTWFRKRAMGSLGEYPHWGARRGRGGIRGEMGRKVAVVEEVGVDHGGKERERIPRRAWRGLQNETEKLKKWWTAMQRSLVSEVHWWPSVSPF